VKLKRYSRQSKKPIIIIQEKPHKNKLNTFSLIASLVINLILALTALFSLEYSNRAQIFIDGDPIVNPNFGLFVKNFGNTCADASYYMIAAKIKISDDTLIIDNNSQPVLGSGSSKFYPYQRINIPIETHDYFNQPRPQNELYIFKWKIKWASSSFFPIFPDYNDSVFYIHRDIENKWVSLGTSDLEQFSKIIKILNENSPVL